MRLPHDLDHRGPFLVKPNVDVIQETRRYADVFEYEEGSSRYSGGAGKSSCANRSFALTRLSIRVCVVALAQPSCHALRVEAAATVDTRHSHG
jgi:hypothetical protein